MTHMWEPKTNLTNVDEPKREDPKDRAQVQDKVPIQIERGSGGEDNWAGKKKSAYIRQQGNVKVEMIVSKPDSAAENIFPRKRRSDLKHQM